MKKNKSGKILFALFVGLFATVVASGCSCTSSLCSKTDEANIKKSIEKNNIEQWRTDAALSNTMKIESNEYIAYANDKIDSIYLTDSIYLESTCGQNSNCTTDELADIKARIKSKYNNQWLNELEALSPEDSGYIKTRTEDFQNFVNTKLEEAYKNHPKACLVTAEDTDPTTGAKIEEKTWADAWGFNAKTNGIKGGLLEGLIVYPISWLMSTLSEAFGGGGLSQLFAIFITVIIIRTLMLVLNFKGQIGTIKMQGLQGELNKLNEKLRDPNLTEQEKQALSMKMMDVYKKNGINPFSTMITQFISFPVFIAVWAAMNQTLAIRKGTLLGLNFGETINTQIFSGSITAIVLFALMIAGQVVTMKLPTWLKARKAQKKNPNKKVEQKSDTEKQMNMMMTFMIGMVVMSGFLLPAALVIYWFLGSLYSIAQTWAFNTDYVTNKLNSFANRKKKAKVIK